MSDYIKYMYREYLEGRTRIKKVNEDQPLFPNTGAGLLTFLIRVRPSRYSRYTYLM